MAIFVVFLEFPSAMKSSFAMDVGAQKESILERKRSCSDAPRPSRMDEGRTRTSQPSRRHISSQSSDIPSNTLPF